MNLTESPLKTAFRSKTPVRDSVIGCKQSKNSEPFWVLVNAEPILDDQGDILHVIVSLVDITERKKLEQKLLREQINQQKLLTQAMIDGQEKERKEIGKELHDNIGQQLTTTKLYLDIAKESADDTTREMISLAVKGIFDVINEVRGMS